MPAVKKYSDIAKKKIDYWGDEIRGLNFKLRVNDTFGTGFGSRARAQKALGIGRRIFNMYITGQRNIPDQVWENLSVFEDILS